MYKITRILAAISLIGVATSVPASVPGAPVQRRGPDRAFPDGLPGARPARSGRGAARQSADPGDGRSHRGAARSFQVLFQRGPSAAGAAAAARSPVRSLLSPRLRRVAAARRLRLGAAARRARRRRPGGRCRHAALRRMRRARRAGRGSRPAGHQADQRRGDAGGQRAGFRPSALHGARPHRTFSAPILRGILAEALYKLSRASTPMAGR